MSCVDWNVLKTIADFPLCLYAFLQSSAPSSLGTGYFVSLSQLPHVCLVLALIYLYNVCSLGCEKNPRNSFSVLKSRLMSILLLRVVSLLKYITCRALGITSQSVMWAWFPAPRTFAPYLAVYGGYRET